MDKGTRPHARDSKPRPTNLGSRSQGGMKEHGLLHGKGMMKANVTNTDFRQETKVYQSIVKELGNIKHRVEQVLADFEDNVEINHDMEEVVGYDNEHFDNLMEQYDKTQREREMILHSLRLFFQNHMYDMDDEDVDAPTNVIEDKGQEDFMIAWKTAQTNIDRIKEINEQLLKMGKELQSLSTSVEIKHVSPSSNKQQFTHMRDKFTTEAKNNMKMSRELLEMEKGMIVLQEKNKILQQEKVAEENRASELVKNIQKAEKQIQELQLEVNKTHKHAIIAESSLKRMENAYTNLKTQTFKLEAENRQLTAEQGSNNENENDGELSTITEQQKSPRGIIIPTIGSRPHSRQSQGSSQKKKKPTKDSKGSQNKTTEKQKKQEPLEKQGTQKNKQNVINCKGRRAKEASVKYIKQQDACKKQNKKSIPTVDYAGQFSKTITKMKQRKEEAMQKRPEMKFGKVTFQKLDFSQSNEEPDEEKSESPTPEDYNELDRATTAPIRNSFTRQYILFNQNEQHIPTHNPRPSATSNTYNGHLQAFGNNTNGFPTSTISVNNLSELDTDKQRLMSLPKLGQRTGSTVGNIRYSLLAARRNKSSSDWQYMKPDVTRPPVKTYRNNDSLTSKLKRKDLFVAWQNGVIVQQGNSMGQCVNTQTRVSSPTDYRFSYKHTKEYYKPSSKNTGMFPLISITPMTLKGST